MRAQRAHFAVPLGSTPRCPAETPAAFGALRIDETAHCFAVISGLLRCRPICNISQRVKEANKRRGHSLNGSPLSYDQGFGMNGGLRTGSLLPLRAEFGRRQRRRKRGVSRVPNSAPGSWWFKRKLLCLRIDLRLSIVAFRGEGPDAARGRDVLLNSL
jgi:hypothetical protein